MKKKILFASIILFVVFLIITILFFFLVKNSEANKEKNDPAEYDVSQIIGKIDFLKLNTYDEIKKYADENLYIRESSDETLFAIGELYIEESPVELFYSLNEDNSISRFDGYYSYELKDSSSDALWDVIAYFDHVIVEYFNVEYFEHSIFDENGAPIDAYDENSCELMLNGKAKYNLSIIDESNTYWNISVVVTDKKQIEFEFFRCFDLSVYDDDSPNIDLRVKEETGEDYDEEQTNK